MDHCWRRLALLVAAVAVPLAGCGRLGVSLLPPAAQDDTADAGDEPDAARPERPPCAGELGDDEDADGVCGLIDNCVAIPNRDQRDRDGDGDGDACDLDDDGDGQPDDLDPCPLDSADDSDGDGSCDSEDRCPSFDDTEDDDADGVPNGCDLVSCGDGVVQPELGETCEPTSTSAPCPEGCDDGVACTSDELTGSPEACTAECAHLPISTPINDDGCCPAGAHALNDLDCTPICGNGVIEPGEACDGGGRCVDCRASFPASLIHRYDFEGSGTTAIDTVGAADGVCINTSVLEGRVDLSRKVTDNYVTFPAGLISGLAEVTFELWLTWDGGEDPQRIFDFGNGNGSDATSFFSLQPRDAQGVLSAMVNFTSTPNDPFTTWRTADFTALSQGAIHHLAVTFDGTTLALYLDGALRGWSTRSHQALSQIDDQNNWLGRSQDASAPELDATIYEFRIYDRALSDSQIQASYQAGSDP